VHHGAPFRIGFGDDALGVLAAVSAFERTQQFGDFVVGDCGQPLKIAPHDGGEVHGRGVRADFCHRRSQMHHGVVFGGNRSVTCGAFGDYGNVMETFSLACTATYCTLPFLATTSPPSLMA